jgi:hypothetical protein
MNIGGMVLRVFGVAVLATLLAGCGEPRAVLLPLQYPDGTPVTTKGGEPLMAGYQTYGSSVHANTTALYQTAKPPTCATCAKVGMVVTEPSVLRQATGVLGAATFGAGAVMAGVGIMDNGVSSTTNVNQTASEGGRGGRRGFGGDRDDGRGRSSDAADRGSPYAHTGWGQEKSNFDFGRY